MFWRHKESQPEPTARAALQTAKAGSWHALDATVRARQMRMFLIASVLGAGMFNNKIQPGKIDASTFGDEEHNAAGSIIGRSIQLMVPPVSLTVVTPFETVEGATATNINEETSEPLTLTTVLLVTGCAMVAGFIAHEVAVVMDNKYFQEEKTKRLVASTARVVETMALHVEREKIAGKLIPFSDEERSVLTDLQGLQREIAAEKNRPFPTPFDGAREFLESATASATAALVPIALGALALIAVSSD